MIKQWITIIKIKTTIMLLKIVQIYRNEYVNDSQMFGGYQKTIDFLYAELDNVCYNIGRKVENGKEGEISMFTVFDIANWFLSKEPMTHKKLQKLCYYAQAWLYVFECNKVSSEFEAWVHGPVNRKLWNKFRSFGYSNIPCDELKKVSVTIDDPEVLDVLNSVWETYGEFTGFELENLTHKETPWIEARKGLENFEPSDRLISKDTMKKYYSDLYIREGVSE